MDFSSHTFEFAKTPVAWYSAGEGKPLLILHGWGSSSQVMKPVAKKLSSRRKSVLIDFPGFGNSPEPPNSWQISDYAELVTTFIQENLNGGPVDFLVHSFGCRVLLKILSERNRPPEIDKIIITGGAGLKPKRSFSFYIKKTTASFLKAPLKLLPGKWQESAGNRLRKTALWRSLGSSDYSKLSGVMRETFVKSVNEFFDLKLADIDREILLLWGKEDTATPLEQGKRMEKGLQNGTLVEIEHAGHYAFLDQPARFAAICEAYLDG